MVFEPFLRCALGCPPYGSGRRGMKIALFRRPKLSFFQQPYRTARTAGERIAPKRTRLHIFQFFFHFHNGNIRSLPYGSGRRGMKIALFRRPKMNIFGSQPTTSQQWGGASGLRHPPTTLPDRPHGRWEDSPQTHASAHFSIFFPFSQR